ncbi:MAG: 5,10-methenyltetrahydromethanopterin hydrogenase cofactor biosynthesis protein HmdB [Desulfurobacteriaceae bacterium]
MSNSCSLRKKCAYCGFAVGTSSDGYFFLTEKREKEVLIAAKSIERSGIQRVSISAGYGNFKKVLRAVEIVKENTNLKVLVNVGGDLTKEKILTLKKVGVDTICCNLETINEKLFKKLKPDDSLKDRIKICYLIKEAEIELSSGILLGIGESEKDRRKHINLLRDIAPEEIPLMRFHPYKDTPMENHPKAPFELLVSTIEKIRKNFPKSLRITIPFPTISKKELPTVIEKGANDIATVVPRDYPLLVKGVGSPKVGILEEILEIIESLGVKTNVRRIQSFQESNF